MTVGRRQLQPLRGFAGQVSWSLAARILAAGLQLAVIILLARGLPPSRFAGVSTVNVILLTITAINGFGLIRQIEYRRSVDRDDPTLPALYATRLRYAYASALGWVAAMLALWAISCATSMCPRWRSSTSMRRGSTGSRPDSCGP